jgi:hypothetical protein
MDLLRSVPNLSRREQRDLVLIILGENQRGVA